MTEVWKPVAGFEGLYEVSNLGNIKALARSVYSTKTGKLHQRRPEKILKPNIGPRGYALVVLCKEGKTFPWLVHRLVASAFIPNPENKLEVDHVDTDTTNNNASNLRWVTRKENSLNPLTRAHNSEAKQGHPCFLKYHTEETKQKLSNARKGKPLSKNHKIALSKSKQAYWQKRKETPHDF